LLYDAPFSHNTVLWTNNRQTDRRTQHCSISATVNSLRSTNTRSFIWYKSISDIQLSVNNNNFYHNKQRLATNIRHKRKKDGHNTVGQVRPVG